METGTTTFWQIYYYIALFATILFVLKLFVFSLFGGDSGSEVVADFNTEFDSDPSFGFLSFQTLLAFFMGFGWMGYASVKQLHLPLLWSFVSAIVVGLIFMTGTAYLMFFAKKLEKNIKKDKKTALNQIGKAYTNFNPNGDGQIEIEINGQLTVTNAVNITGETINAFEPIKVVKVENEVMFVEKVNK